MSLATCVTTFVTAFLDLEEDRYRDRSIKTYMSQFKTLAQAKINLVCFVSYHLVHMMEPRTNVQLVPIELDDLKSIQLFRKTVEDGTLLYKPPKENANKNTQYFMLLMNSKLEFLRRAMDLNFFHTPQYAWIDFGITHVFKDLPKSLFRLEEIANSEMVQDCIMIPGCWSVDVPLPLSYEISWRFCGGFLLGSVRELRMFHDLFLDTFAEILTKYGLSFETNVWALLESQYRLPIAWYKADHDDSIIHVPRPWMVLKTIQSNAPLQDIKIEQ